MKKLKDEFEPLFADQACTTCDCPLAWTWDEEELAFTATCGCFRRHKLTPTEAILTLADPDEDAEELDAEGDWD